MSTANVRGAVPFCPVQPSRLSHMPSFDIVSEIDQHEVTNAVDQASREVGQRFDFKGSNAKFEFKDGRDNAKRAS